MGVYTPGTIENIVDHSTTTSSTDGDDAVNLNVTGNYIVNYTVTDAAGNSKTIQETVNVTDMVTPTFTVDGNSDDFTTNVELVDGVYTPGTIENIVDHSTTTSSTDGDDAVNLNVTGNYIVNYTVTDAAGNSKTITRKRPCHLYDQTPRNNSQRCIESN